MNPLKHNLLMNYYYIDFQYVIVNDYNIISVHQIIHVQQNNQHNIHIIVNITDNNIIITCKPIDNEYNEYDVEHAKSPDAKITLSCK